MKRSVLTPLLKARRINLDANKYGTFAEIGAGQEVVRWFFLAGGASGTVAKTMSAYDMAVSDAIYGKCARYVSRARLFQMLDHEYPLLVSRLSKKRGASSTFFTLADTVATGSTKSRVDGRGWIGIRFQHEPRAEPSQVLLHARLLEPDNLRQQEAIGLLGVNLVYGVFFKRRDTRDFLCSLLDNLTRDRIELNMVRFSGPGFKGVDNRLMSLHAVRLGYTPATVFSQAGEGGAGRRTSLRPFAAGPARQLPADHPPRPRHHQTGAQGGLVCEGRQTDRTVRTVRAGPAGPDPQTHRGFLATGGHAPGSGQVGAAFADGALSHAAGLPKTLHEAPDCVPPRPAQPEGSVQQPLLRGPAPAACSKAWAGCSWAM